MYKEVEEKFYTLRFAKQANKSLQINGLSV